MSGVVPGVSVDSHFMNFFLNVNLSTTFLPVFLAPFFTLRCLSLEFVRSRLDRTFLWLYFRRMSIPPPTDWSGLGEERTSRKGTSREIPGQYEGRTLFALLAIAAIALGQFVWPQKLDFCSGLKRSSQGQTGAQPEGAFS